MHRTRHPTLVYERGIDDDVSVPEADLVTVLALVVVHGLVAAHLLCRRLGGPGLGWLWPRAPPPRLAGGGGLEGRALGLAPPPGVGLAGVLTCVPVSRTLGRVLRAPTRAILLGGRVRATTQLLLLLPCLLLVQGLLARLLLSLLLLGILHLLGLQLLLLLLLLMKKLLLLQLLLLLLLLHQKVLLLLLLILMRVLLWRPSVRRRSLASATRPVRVRRGHGGGRSRRGLVGRVVGGGARLSTALLWGRLLLVLWRGLLLLLLVLLLLLLLLLVLLLLLLLLVRLGRLLVITGLLWHWGRSLESVLRHILPSSLKTALLFLVLLLSLDIVVADVADHFRVCLESKRLRIVDHSCKLSFGRLEFSMVLCLGLGLK